MLAIPAAQYFAIVVFIKLGVLIVIAVLVVAFAMAFSLCERHAAAGEKYRQGGGDSPFCYFHEDS
jgi:hypothetical protein